MATTLSNDILSVALCAREVLDLGLPPTLDVRACLAAVRSLPVLEWPSDLENFATEIDAIMMELKGEELEVVSAGTVAGAATGDDVGRRTSEVESLASVASEVLGEELLEEQDPLEEVPEEPERKAKYPRVDPPEVEDQPGQAIREDTPGYISKAFPKLFPCGTGDYHGDHGDLARTLRFEEWS